MDHQKKISSAKLKNKVSTEMEVIVDEINRREIIARTKYDAPDIDGLVYIKNNGLNNINVGDIIKVKINNSNDYDLFAKLI